MSKESEAIRESKDEEEDVSDDDLVELVQDPADKIGLKRPSHLYPVHLHTRIIV